MQIPPISIHPQYIATIQIIKVMKTIEPFSGSYYSTNPKTRTIWDEETDIPMCEQEARERLKELQACIDNLSSMEDPRDPMDIYKEKIESL